MALGIQIVGTILIAAMLVILTGAVRNFANIPEVMALIDAAFGTCTMLGVFAASLHLDMPTNPNIICCAELFLVSTLLVTLRGRSSS